MATVNICAVTTDGTLARHEAEEDARQARETDIERRLGALRLQSLAPTREALEGVDEWLGNVLGEDEVVAYGLADAIRQYLGSGGDYLEMPAYWGRALRAAWERHLLDLATREADDAAAGPTERDDDEAFRDEIDQIERVRGAGGTL